MQRKAIAVPIAEFAVVMAVLLVVGLALPIRHITLNQFLVGPIVNCALIYAAVRFKNIFAAGAIIFTPSVCAMTLGFVGVSGLFAMYMIPFIWAGNMALVLGFRYLYAQRRHTTINYATTATLAIAAKVLVIFAGFQILHAAVHMPAMLVMTFGIYQVVTATIGAAMAYVLLKFIRV